MAKDSSEAGCLAVLNARIEECSALQKKQAESGGDTKAAETKLEEARARFTERQGELNAAEQRLAADDTPENQALVEQAKAAVATATEAMKQARAKLVEADQQAEQAGRDASEARDSYEKLSCEFLKRKGELTPFAEADGPCGWLGTYIGAKKADIGHPTPDTVREAKQIGALEAQPERKTANNKSGTVAQIEPVETTKPINLFGGALSVAGTEVGTLAAATVSVNPWALADPNNVKAQRLTDVSVTVPFALSSLDTENLEFVAVRLRVNLTALTSTGALEQALERYAAAAGRYEDNLEQVFRGAPDVARCFESVERTLEVSRAACGADLDSAYLEKVRAESYAALAAARQAADRYYFGLDLRGDFGDPTGDAVLGDDGTHLLAGLAGGLRIPLGERWDWEIRGRVAGDYLKLRERDADGARVEALYAADYGAAMLLTGTPATEITKQRLQFGVGVEGKEAQGAEATAALAQTNFVDLNLMAVVPTANGSDLAIKARIPLREGTIERGTVVTVTGDFGVLSNQSD